MFRFTIRDALWLMVVVFVAAGWWMNSASLLRDRQKLVLDHDATKTELLKRSTELDERCNQLVIDLHEKGYGAVFRDGKWVLHQINPIPRQPSAEPNP